MRTSGGPVSPVICIGVSASSRLVGLKYFCVAAGVNLPFAVLSLAEPNLLLPFNLNDFAVMNQDLDRPEANLRQGRENLLPRFLGQPAFPHRFFRFNHMSSAFVDKQRDYPSALLGIGKHFLQNFFEGDLGQ